MVHGTGQTYLAGDLVIHPRLIAAARGALKSGAPIITDAHMVASGVTRARLPRDNEVLCLLRRSEEHTSELQSLMRISYAVFCLKKTNKVLIHMINHNVKNNNNLHIQK